jgi:hypothetical protein
LDKKEQSEWVNTVSEKVLGASSYVVVVHYKSKKNEWERYTLAI